MRDGRTTGTGKPAVTGGQRKPLLEYLKANQEICTRRKSPTSPPATSFLADGLRVHRVRRDRRPAPTSTSIFVRTRCPTSSRRAARRMCRRSFSCIVVPEDLEDLPADRRQYGFGGANFRYGNTAALAFGDQCAMEHPLPTIPSPASGPGSSPPKATRSGWRVPRRRGGRRTAAVYCCPIVLRKPGPYMETICVKRQHACEHHDARRSAPLGNGREHGWSSCWRQSHGRHSAA